jgi:hypothetical protein
MKYRTPILASLLSGLFVCGLTPPAQAQYTQQGPKLYGTGAVAAAKQGYSVAISQDGSTAIVGGPYDNYGTGPGAVWVYTRTNGVWSQQGNKLVPAGVAVPGGAGWSVALSGDGNTAIVGAPYDNSQQFRGSALIFTRSNGVWAQQQRLTGAAASASAEQGFSVAMSTDGKTALVGGPGDSSGFGASWVFTLANGVWTEQQKLFSSDSMGYAQQGSSVALSGDGNTAIIGGPLDNTQGNNAAGAAWIFKRTNGVWSQQGNKLVGTAAAGVLASQGYSVAINSDGSTAIVGGPTGLGGAWVFTLSNGIWSQQAGPLANPNATSSSSDGHSVALSGDGNTAIVGGSGDNDAWVFTRSNGVWTRRQELTTPPQAGQPPTALGFSAAISGDATTVILGGIEDGNQQVSYLGAAWIFAASSYSLTATAGTPQAAPVGTSFATNLQATVMYGTSPAAGTTVTFTAPNSGASGTFPGSSLTAPVITNASGVATAPAFTANGIAGAYGVTASVVGVTAPANFALTNTSSVGCTITWAPTSVQVGSAGSSGLTIAVSANVGCTWTAISNAAWIHLVSGANGSGSGTITYNVDPNTSPLYQNGTISLAGQSITLTQAPPVATNTEAFVRQLYLDILSRTADANGLSTWVNWINTGVYTRAQVASQFFKSQEFYGTGNYITLLYLGIMLRDPDYGGWTGWFNNLHNGYTQTDILNAFLASPEFQSRYGNLDNTAFVTLLYNNMLNRAPDQAGLTQWVAWLNNGTYTRAQVANSFITSPEFQLREGNRVYANMLYIGFLRRVGDPNGLNGWTNWLTNGTFTLDQEVNGFITSPEYLARF